MKKVSFLLFVLFPILMFSQEHFTGISTSSRVGLLNASVNPAELINMSNNFEFNLIGISVNVANNKIGFSDITSGANFKDLIFKTNDPVNMSVDAQAQGIGLAFKVKKWTFGIGTKVNAKMDLININNTIGDAIVNSNLALSSTAIGNIGNQRISGTTWGEINVTAARNLISIGNHRLNIGGTLKILFPGSYTNLGTDQFTGTVSTISGQSYLTNASASMNFAYSGSLANNFTNFQDYSSSVFGKPNGFGTDIGINYQWLDSVKDDNSDEKASKKHQNKYKLNLGVAIRNLGAMTYKDDNNSTTNYILNIQGVQSLNLNQFNNVQSIKDIETTLLASGFLTKVSNNNDIKVKLPTTLSIYGDLKLVSKLFLSAYFQQKFENNKVNAQITAQNIITVTPRFSTGYFEAFVPITKSDISGFNTGVGFRVGGFYIGSGSIITAAINNSKQADIYTGFRWAFL